MAYTREQMRAYTEAHREHIYEQNCSNAFKIRQKALDVLGGVCVRCGFADRRALQIDHINGGGSKEYRDIGNTKVYRRIAKGLDLERYQLLCANCNFIKRVENAEFAHAYRFAKQGGGA